MSARCLDRPIPADVRAAGAQGRKLYDAALGFEQTLVRTLAAQLTEHDRLPTASDEDGGRRRRRPGIIRDQIPDALADGIAATAASASRTSSTSA